MSEHPIVHIDLSAVAARDAGKFYEQVFGWKISVDETFDYVMFQAEGGPGGGFMNIGPDNPAGTVIPYLQSADIEGDLQRIEQNGGETVQPKTEIAGTGWFALFTDPSGNRMGLFTWKG